MEPWSKKVLRVVFGMFIYLYVTFIFLSLRGGELIFQFIDPYIFSVTISNFSVTLSSLKSIFWFLFPIPSHLKTINFNLRWNHYLFSLSSPSLSRRVLYCEQHFSLICNVR